MTPIFRNRSRLLGGCAGAALALGLALAPERAAAQGIQASGDVVFGTASIVDTGPTTTQIDLLTNTVVIDWSPTLDINGDPLPFIDTGRTALFQSDVTSNFAVLNRILPVGNNVVFIDGTVISQFAPMIGDPTSAGLVAFYSPTGILVGGNAIFDVGRLLLTTLDTSDASFNNFAAGGNLALAGVANTATQVIISPGAQITATPENAFFAVVAADIQMSGIAQINGSSAFVAGEVVNLSFSNGLFNISVPVGTSVPGQVITVDGTVGGPSSTGATNDNHMIYGVAHAAADPISMLFSGNLGFAPAMTAGVVNGEIILAANYNVAGRFVAGGTISDGIGATFRQTDGTTNVRADIVISDVTATSSLLAVGTHDVRAEATGANSSVAGNLLLVGRENAELAADSGRSFAITGDVLVDARDYGVVSSSLMSLDQINAQAGNASILADLAASVTIGGDALITADAFGGADDINAIAGFARGGSAVLGADDTSLVNVTGNVTLSARGEGTSSIQAITGAEARGGTASLLVARDGAVGIGQSLEMRVDAEAVNGSLFNPSSVSDAFGGTARIEVSSDGGGTIGVAGAAFIDASARGGSSNNSGAGSVGDAGVAVIEQAGPGSINIGDVRIQADGTGGANAGGVGGAGLGGRASVLLDGGGLITFNGDFSADAAGFGGNGLNGGAGLGGIAGVTAVTGDVDIAGDAFAGSDGIGGNASFLFGGQGGLGRGGNSYFQAEGNASQTASITIGSDGTVSSRGTGGRGGSSDGSVIPAGRGGDGYGGSFTEPNQADANFNSGAFVLAGGDYGTILSGGETLVALAQGYGGDGGAGGSLFVGGNGGNGFGGLAQVGLALLGGTGLVGQGEALLGNILVQADGFGGNGGFSIGDFETGDGGNGTGGVAALTVRAGTVSAALIELNAGGFGGGGALAGAGQGGDAAIFGGFGGTFSSNETFISARGFGGFSGIGTGGNGLGGLAAIDGVGVTIAIDGDVALDATGIGGGTDEAFSGNGIGGTARITAAIIDTNPGSVTITGHARVYADGLGGGTESLGAGADGFGGLAFLETTAGGDIALGSTQVTASGFGGLSIFDQGGNGTGGQVSVRANDAGSTITIARNLPLAFIENANGSALLAANGIGEATAGGTGTGGTGTGGWVEIAATDGGFVRFPSETDIINDPGSASPQMLFAARGIGGDSEVDGGLGGNGVGGEGLIEVDGIGSEIIIGPTNFSVFGRGGSGSFSSATVTGGTGFGGTRAINVLGGSQLTFQGEFGVSGGTGGNGSGAGNGGAGVGGSNQVTVEDSTLNVIGRLQIIDQSLGGSGVVGGDALGGGQGGSVAFTATNATINLNPDVGGSDGLTLLGLANGGNGDAQGGRGIAPDIALSLTNTQVNGGRLQVTALAQGGNAFSTPGIGGNATTGSVLTFISGSDLVMTGENLFAADAFGGAGGLSGQGGSALNSVVNVTITNTAVAISPGVQSDPGVLRVRARASGGAGGTVGNATSSNAFLSLSQADITANLVDVLAQASATGTAGEAGGIATAGNARLSMAGSGTLDADEILINAGASTSLGGTSAAGVAVFSVTGGTSPLVTAGVLRVLADATGADPGDLANGAGQFAVSVASGSVNLGELLASAQGDAIFGDPGASELTTLGGDLNVANSLTAQALGDITISLFGGGLIGGLPVTATTTDIIVRSVGDIVVQDDDSGLLGLGGRSIALTAGGSVLLDGIIAVNDGSIAITANDGTGLPLSVDETSQITMSAGALLDAGTGLVTIGMGSGFGVPGRLSGGITLSNISAGSIGVRNLGGDPGSDITVLATGVLTASGSGRAIDLASINGEVINLHGDAGLVLTGGGHFGVFAATPTGSQIGSFANYARRYNVADAGAYDDIDLGGNFAAFRITPTLTVTADDVSRFYGDANALLTATFTGFQPGDSIADLLGAPELATLADGTSNVGQYTITAEIGTLLSEQGYAFDFAPGTLTVTPRPLTISADDIAKLLGQPDPALTFTLGGAGLVNGDTLSVGLVREPGEGLGSYTIRESILSAGPNYLVTFTPGIFTIGAPPAPPELTSPTLLEPATGEDEETPLLRIQDEDEDPFGMDFPEQPDAVLIADDGLLDDPVTSGGDPSLYGGGDISRSGGQ